MRKYNNDIIELNEPNWKSVLPAVKFIDSGNKLINENKKPVNNTKYDPWKYETLEQYLVNKWVLSEDKVLQIGNGYGYIALTVNSRLHNKKYHIVIEPNSKIIKILKYNRKKFKGKFKITKKIISSKPLIQVIQDQQSRDYIQDEVIAPDIFFKKYDIIFNVLIVNNEICIESLLKNMKEILQQLELIIFKKDNTDICNYNIINLLLQEAQFTLRESLVDSLYQVWSK
jgi:hypothetical protein